MSRVAGVVVVKSVADGMSYSDAAVKYGLTRNAVSGLCYRAGLKVGHKKRMGRPQTRARMSAAQSAVRSDPKRDAKRLAALRVAMQRVANHSSA